MSDLKRKRFFRKWKRDFSTSTFKKSTSQTSPGLAAPDWENSADSVVASTVPVGEDVPKALEVLPEPGRGDLWGLAYKQLLAENEPLVRRYEEVLKTAGIVPDDSAADIQEQIQAVLVLKRKQILQKQWTLQWGNKPIKVRTQIDRIVKIIGAFKEAGSVVANVDPLHAGLPWAGVCFLLSPILNDSEQGGVLLSGLEMITDLVARHRIADEHLTRDPRPDSSDFYSDVEYRKILIKLYTKVLEFQAKAACYLSHGPLIRFARNIPKVDDWATLQSSIVRIETECRDYTIFKFAMDQQSSMRSLIELLDEQEERLTDLIANQNLQQDAALMVTRLISDIPVGQDHEDIRTRLGSQYWDSGKWLFESRQYLDWATCHCSSILWLQGPVGVGKSCMTSIVIQHFLAHAIDNRVAFFYCSQEHNSSADILRALLAQMSYGTDGNLVQPVCKWFELQTGVPFRTSKKLYTSVLPHLARKISSKECVELLGEIIPYTTQTTFIIDALDECHDHHELLDDLKNMQERFSNLKLFISSRMGIYPKYKFPHRNVIEHLDSSSDMIHFIDCEISSPARRDRSGMTPVQARVLRRLLVCKANGMFRWVELQLDVFLNRNNPILHPADVQIKLEQLRIMSTHPSLTAIYRDLFSLNTQEQPYRRALAIEALQWVFCAFKPLTIEGLAQAVAFGSDGSIDPVVTGDFLLQVCGSFIIVTNSGSVRFAHRSAKEYVTHHLASDFSVPNAHAQMAGTCLSFLLTFEDASKWANLPTNIHEESIGLSLTAFEMYACFFWAPHYAIARKYERLKDLFDRFVFVRWETLREDEVTLASTAFQRWISLLWRVFQTDSNLEDLIRRRLEDAISDPPTPLFTACIWGFESTISKVVHRESPTVTLHNNASLSRYHTAKFKAGPRASKIVNLRNHREKSCLYLACENGQERAVITLRCCQALVDGGHERWGSDLHAAASSGLLNIFSMILRVSTQVNPPDGLYGRTIEAAIHGGNPAIVTDALKRGAEVWLPSTDAPVRPRQRHLRSLYSTEISSSDRLSDKDSVLSDSTQDLVAHPGLPRLGNKDSTPPEHRDLVERLHKANRRRRELLNYQRLANHMAAVDLRASDGLVIAEEVSGYLTRSREGSADEYPFQTEGAGVSYSRCYYCFELEYTSNTLFWWRRHILHDLLPYLCPFADCNLKNKMWGVRSDWAAHLNDQHSMPNVQGVDTERYAFTCNICCRTFEKSDNRWCISPASHYADHMERIALSVRTDYGPDASASSRKRIPKVYSKRRRKHRYRSGLASGHDSSSSGHDEEAISGWSSEGSTGSRG